MNDTNQRETVSIRSVARRAGPFAIGLLLAAATASSVYCQTITGPDAVAATAGGWRLAVTSPAPGSTSRPAAVFCYEITGTTREPVLALEITPMHPGEGPAAATVRVDVNVGRSSVTADLSAAGEGLFDLRVQLVVDDSRGEQPSVLIRGVRLSNNAPRGTCS